MDDSEFIRDEFEFVPVMQCKVCGENEFDLQEGYYNCRECGTVTEQIRLIQVEAEEGADYEAGKFAKKKKIKVEKVDELNLTSWECYNYILRGFVEELIAFGAKEELKLMTLQVWAAYLRRMEVAFINKKFAELPHLGVRYADKDAEILYNHKKINKKRKRANTDDSITSGEMSGRQYRTSLRKLDESCYSIQTDTSAENTSFRTSENSTSTGTTSRAIQMRLSKTAKKCLKKNMKIPSRQGSTKCQSKIKAYELKRSVNATHTLNIKQIYGILAISLNLIEDDIQLSDLTRFIADDHISTKNVINYFPENLTLNIRKILNDMQFYFFPDKFSYQYMREHIGCLAKFLNIREFKVPNIVSLIERYITELDLPVYLSVIIQRLVNVLPPNMCTRRSHLYQPFEARAMAYIVFVLKLLFGLDGKKETLISQSAQKINQKLNSLSTDKSKPIHSELFVWSEWVEYIEMRKTILSQVNLNFAQHFGQSEYTTELIVEEMQRNQQRQEDDDLEFNTNNMNSTSTKNLNAQAIFSSFLNKFNNYANPTETFPTKPSFTPAHTYFQRLLLNKSNSNGSSVSKHIPEFMNIDHGQRSVEPYLCENGLHICLAQHNVPLIVEPLACNSNRDFVGIFRIPAKQTATKTKRTGITKKQLGVLKADFNINEEEWRNHITNTNTMEDLEFKTEYDSYDRIYMKRKRASKKLNLSLEKVSYRTTSDRSYKDTNKSDMDPLVKIEMAVPRKNLNSDDIFADISDEHEKTEKRCIEQVTPFTLSAQNGESSKMDDKNVLKLHTSKMDYWQILGSPSALALITEVQKKTLAAKFPLSFFWLLQTCAQTIGADWTIIYEQLLAIEVMFGHGLKNLDNFTNCLHYKYNLSIKDFNILVNQYREFW